MGYFVSLPISQWIKEFQLNAFVETGTWRGAGIACARCFNDLEEFHSIEISEKLYRDASAMFLPFEEVQINHGTSYDVLPKVLEKKSLQEKNILFWLDAHLPEVYGVPTDDMKTRLPLEDELEIILRMRPENKDLIIVDDLRLYEEGNYESGNMEPRLCDNCDFVQEMVGDRYDITKAIWQTGFLILTPKQ